MIDNLYNSWYKLYIMKTLGLPCSYLSWITWVAKAHSDFPWHDDKSWVTSIGSHDPHWSPEQQAEFSLGPKKALSISIFCPEKHIRSNSSIALFSKIKVENLENEFLTIHKNSENLNCRIWITIFDLFLSTNITFCYFERASGKLFFHTSCPGGAIEILRNFRTSFTYLMWIILGTHCYSICGLHRWKELKINKSFWVQDTSLGHFTICSFKMLGQPQLC